MQARWLWALLLASGTALAEADIQTAAGRSQERQRIEAERNFANAQFDARDAECQARFVVTSCRSQVRLERIRSDGEFKRQESILIRLDRQAAAARQQQKLDEKAR
jgi:colicin import membrane protein